MRSFFQNEDNLLTEIVQGIFYLHSFNLFKGDLKSQLNNCTTTMMFYFLSNGFLPVFLKFYMKSIVLRFFKLSGFEHAFDFAFDPVTSFNKSLFNGFYVDGIIETIYSLDNKIVKKSDGKMKSQLYSFFKKYNRGKKLNIGVPIQRIELNINGIYKHHYQLSDLDMTYSEFLTAQEKTLSKILKKVIVPGSIQFEPRIREISASLYRILKDAALIE